MSGTAYRFNTAGSTPQTQLIPSYLATATTQVSGEVRNDQNLAFTIEPVIPNTLGNSPPWQPDHLTTDVYRIAMGLPDQPPTQGTFALNILSATVAITSASIANPTNILAPGHGLSAGTSTVFITGMSSEVPTISGYYVATYVDANNFTIPVNVTTGGTGGTVQRVNTTNLTSLAYNITAGALQTPLSTAFVAQGYPSLTATALGNTAFLLVGATNGTIPTGVIQPNGADLIPYCDLFVSEQTLGTATTPFQLLLIIRQGPIAFQELSGSGVQLPTATVQVDSVQAGSATTDEIVAIDFDVTNTYGGTFSVALVAGNNPIAITSASVATTTVITTAAPHGLTNGSILSIFIEGMANTVPTVAGTYTATVTGASTLTIPVDVTTAGSGGDFRVMTTASCGVATFGMSVQAFGLLLANHPAVNYQNQNGTPNNIVVTANGSNYQVQFLGTLGNTASPVLSVNNINLQAAEGVAGFISLNTFALEQFSLTTTNSTFQTSLSIQRTRASGEVRTIFGPVTITLSKEIIDVASMVPVPQSSFYTQQESDARYGQLVAANTWTAANTISSSGTLILNGAIGGTITGGTLNATGATFKLFEPYITASINDVNGHGIIGLTPATSAVNEINVGNSATGNPLTLTAAGSDTNITINVVPKGTGVFEVNGTALGTGAFAAAFNPAIPGAIGGTTPSTGAFTTVNGITETSGTNTFTLAVGTASLTVPAATSGSLGSAAFTASSAYLPVSGNSTYTGGQIVLIGTQLYLNGGANITGDGSTVNLNMLTWGYVALPSTAFGSPLEGMIYGDSTAHHIYYRTNTAWVQLDPTTPPNPGTPTVAAGAGAGTSPTVTIVSGGTNRSYQLSVVTGTLPTGGATVATVTYSAAWATATNPVLTPANANAALLSGATMIYSAGSTTTATVTAGATGLTAATTYIWNVFSNPE
jgi:hypothetical protein